MERAAWVQKITRDYVKKNSDQDTKVSRRSKIHEKEQWEIEVQFSSIESPSNAEKYAFLDKLWTKFECYNFKTTDKNLKTTDSDDKFVLLFKLQGLNLEARQSFECNRNCRCGPLWRELCTTKISKERISK